MPGFLLPVYDLIHNGLLFGRGFTKVYAGGFNALVPHKVGETCNVVAAFQEALCKAVSEGVWVNDHRVDAIPYCQLF